MSQGRVLAFAVSGVLCLGFLCGCADSRTADTRGETERKDLVSKVPDSQISAKDFVKVQDAEAQFPLALEGYCPVSLYEDNSWVPGDKKFGAIHRGRLYLFGSYNNQIKFLKEPDAYSPALAGYDVVTFAIDDSLCDGIRTFRVKYQGRFYFFADGKTKSEFEKSPDAFAEVAKLTEHSEQR
jgi:YHS domain-containing protein